MIHHHSAFHNKRPPTPGDRFSTSHIIYFSFTVSWSGLKPRNEESAGKIKSRKITHGNKYLRQTLIECSWAASHKQGCFYNKFSYHQTVVRHKNKMKVQVAVARKILTAIWFILHNNVAYKDYTPDIVAE